MVEPMNDPMSDIAPVRRVGPAVVWLLATFVVCGSAGAIDDDVVVDAGPDEAGIRQPHLIYLGANFDANLF